MRSLFTFIVFLCINFHSFSQYPFDSYKKPDFKSYNDWKLYDKNDGKIHQTITIPEFYDKKTDLTLQFTVEKREEQTNNIIRIYKGDKLIQSFRKSEIDYMPNFITSPVRVTDLNNDGKFDIKITYNYNSNGLNLSYRPVYLIQKQNNRFIKYSFDNMFEGRSDLERDFDNDNVFEILSVTLITINSHNYWRFNIFSIKENRIVDISSKYNYPIFIQFLNKKNYKQAKNVYDIKNRDYKKVFNILTDYGTEVF